MATELSATGGPREDVAAVEAGLDALESRPGAERRWNARRITIRALGILVTLAIVLALWQLISFFKPDYVFPSPVETYQQFHDVYGWSTLASVVWTSVHRAVIGFLISVAIATPLGLFIWSVKPVRTFFSPILSGLQSLPSVAWVPAAVIWFGTTEKALYMVVLLGAIPSIANGLMSGLDNIPTLYRRAGYVLGARGWRNSRYVLLPASLPGYLSGLRQGWAFSWRSLMAAELIAHSKALGQGLGQTLDNFRNLTSMGGIFATIIAILFVGVVIELCIFAPVERTVLARRGLGGRTAPGTA
ncbi:MAG: sulfonate transport system permease protein [Frankiaceae bacterium]|nr:sulfonate transport system permease protein [Frankiaceae bacterium]